jgi:hypothetical protein
LTERRSRFALLDPPLQDGHLLAGRIGAGLKDTTNWAWDYGLP